MQCSLLRLGKFSQSLQETHCNPPPQTFEITFITAVSSCSSLLFCCRRLGHTNLHPVLQSLKSVCKGERGDSTQPGRSGVAGAVAVPCLPLLPCRSRGLAVPFAPTCSPKSPCFIPSLNQWLSQRRGTRQNFSADSEKLRKGLWLYIHYKCLRLHTFQLTAKDVV